MKYEYDCRKKTIQAFYFNPDGCLIHIVSIALGSFFVRSGARLFRASTGGQWCPRVQRSLWTLFSQIPSGKTEAAPCDICAAFSRSNRGKHEEKEEDFAVTGIQLQVLRFWVVAPQVIVHALLLGEVDKEWS